MIHAWIWLMRIVKRFRRLENRSEQFKDTCTESGLYCILQVIQLLLFFSLRAICTLWNWTRFAEVPFDDILVICSFILASSSKIIKYLGRNNKNSLRISIVLSLIAIGLMFAAAFIKLINENYSINLNTTIKVPITFGLYAYLMAEFYGNVSANVKLICDAWQMLKTLNHAQPERQGNVSSVVPTEEIPCKFQAVQVIQIVGNVFAVMGFMVVLVMTSRLVFCSALSCPWWQFSRIITSIPTLL